jgi:hypothetical protein
MLLKMVPLHYTQVLCQYRLSKVDHVYVTYIMLQQLYVRPHLSTMIVSTPFSAWSSGKLVGVHWKACFSMSLVRSFAVLVKLEINTV